MVELHMERKVHKPRPTDVFHGCDVDCIRESQSTDWEEVPMVRRELVEHLLFAFATRAARRAAAGVRGRVRFLRYLATHHDLVISTHTVSCLHRRLVLRAM